MFAKRLRELREKKNLSQEALAEKLGIPRSTITHYENDTDRLPRRARLDEIASFFNVTTDYLLGRSDVTTLENTLISTSDEDPELRKAIGMRIRGLREKRNLTQIALADKLGMPHQNLSNYERGFRQPDYETLIAISDFFNVSTDFLLKGKDLSPEVNRALNDPNTQIAARDGNITDEEAVELLEWLLEREKGRKPGDKQKRK
ncbi:transcriptional regulator [Cytobacillus firmus DS1]|uniref:Transcriptional regulator n=2 Tax=Cytobacillus firmus TaxID=1399 RepID=W7KZZ8_CYTFI|nr:transcriptional regulator [Cytobacillus firmus DS1]